MPEPLFIGIDGGGTNCRARVADFAGKVVGEGTGGPANLTLGPALVMRSILTAVHAAAAGKLVDADLNCAHAGFALAGTELPGASRRLLAEPHPFASAVVDTDSFGALLGAFSGRDGAVLILGTGSAGLAIVGGRRFRVAGYGAQISDEASGMWLGRESIRRALWVEDGRAPASGLATEILSRFKSSPEEIVAFAAKATPADYAKFAPDVFEHAREKDALAVALLSEASADASRMIERLIAFGAPSVCLLGGIAEPLSEWLPPPVRLRLSKPEGDALDGAILMARRAYEANEKVRA